MLMIKITQYYLFEGFRLIDPESYPVQQYLKKFPNSGNGKENYLYSANALIYDSVWVFAKALNDLDSLQDMELQRLRYTTLLILSTDF